MRAASSASLPFGRVGEAGLQIASRACRSLPASLVAASTWACTVASVMGGGDCACAVPAKINAPAPARVEATLFTAWYLLAICRHLQTDRANGVVSTITQSMSARLLKAPALATGAKRNAGGNAFVFRHQTAVTPSAAERNAFDGY